MSQPSLFFLFQQIREHCLQKLTSTLYNNFTQYYAENAVKMAASDYEPEICAIEEEYKIFSTSRAGTLYKGAVLKKVNEIKKCTDSKDLHVSLQPKSNAATTGFISASDLIKEREAGEASVDNESVGLDSEASCSEETNATSAAPRMNGFITASDLLSKQRRVEHKKADQNSTSTDNLTKHAANRKQSASQSKKTVPKITYFFEKKDSSKVEVKEEPESTSSSSSFYNASVTDYRSEHLKTALPPLPSLPTEMLNIKTETEEEDQNNRFDKFVSSWYSGTLLVRPPLLHQKCGLSRGLASHQGEISIYLCFDLHCQGACPEGMASFQGGL